ncbi:MMPL family transporter [Humibacter soli]
MSSFLYSVGRWAFRARALVVVCWLVVLAAAIGCAALFGTGTQNTYAIPGTESQQALDALARTFPQMSGATAQMVAVAPKGSSVKDSTFESAIDDSVKRLSALPQVASVTSPYSSTSSANISSDESAVIVPVQLAVVQSQVAPSTADALQAEAHRLQTQLPSGSQAAMGGQLFSQTAAGISVTELLGIAVAFGVLALTFASLLVATMPLVTSLLGVGVALSVILALTSVTTITSTTPLLALMLGLAVGIDYALFITSRHQDQVRSGIDPEESAARSVATAGSAVVFAAVTVIIALVGLSVAGIPFLTTMGVASAGAVALAVLVSLTLTPALLGFAGWRVVRRRYRPGESARMPRSKRARERKARRDAAAALGETDRPPRFFVGWVRGATKWPVLTIVVIVAALGILTVPITQLRLALPDAGSLPAGEPGRVTYDLIDEHFGPGYNGPLIMTGSVIQSKDPVGLMNDLGASIAKVPGVVAVPLSTPNQDGDTGVVQVIPNGSPDSVATEQVVARLRAMHDTFQKQYGVDLAVTGYTAAGIDVSERLGQALLPFGILVVGLSLVLLAMVFRSIVVPVTAALGYLLSIGAAFGITSLVFESGFLAGPLGVESLGSVISFMPIILMGVLFGLAMDYEVFLVSRMREDYVHHGEPKEAITRGFLGSARVVTAAAIIMFAVFAAFVPEGDASIQPIALGLAVGVAIDAFVVRMTLIPAVLTLFGRGAWWMPRALDRVLPHFDAEGEGIANEIALAGWPDDADELAVAAEDVTIEKSGLELVSGFTARVPYGGVLVVRSDDRVAGAALVAALCGRAPVTSGRLRVDGRVLPSRSGAVRSHSGVVTLRGASDPLGAVRLVLGDDVTLIGLCDVEGIVDARDRAAVADVLRRARAASGGRLTVVASCSPDADVDDVVGLDGVQESTLGAWSGVPDTAAAMEPEVS